MQLFIFENFILKRSPKPVIDPRASRFLQSVYGSEIKRLEGLLGRPLPQLRRSWDDRGGVRQRRAA